MPKHVIELPIIAADWAGAGKQIVAVNQAGEVFYYPNMADLLRANAPCVVATESSFASYPYDVRNAYIDLAGELRCEIWVMPPRTTKNTRGVFAIEKSDINDAIVILDRFLDGTGIFIPARRLGGPVDEQLNEFRGPLAYSVALSRTRDWADETVQEALRFMGNPIAVGLPFADLCKTNRQKRRVWLGEQWIAFAIAALAVLKAGRGKRYFRSAVGCHEHGYPNIFRSIFYYGLVRTLTRQLSPKDIYNSWRKEVKAAGEAKVLGPPHPQEVVDARKRALKECEALVIFVWKRVRENYLSQARQLGIAA